MSEVKSAWEQFQALPESPANEARHAVPCGSGGLHLLLKGPGASPILLLRIRPRKEPRPPIRLKHVAVAFDVLYRLTSTETGGAEDARFCRLQCDEASDALHRCFVELVLAMAGPFEAELGQARVDETVDALIELFRKATAPPHKLITGLWAELLLIDLAANPERWVSAWHLALTDRFDFSFGTCRVEVKATERDAREHEFALRQVRGGKPSDYVASVVLASSAAGDSVLDLSTAIAARLDASTQYKLWSVVLATLGDDPDFSEDRRFDRAAAADSVRFVETFRVPAPRVDPGDEACVADVHFRGRIGPICSSYGLTAAQWFERPGG